LQALPTAMLLETLRAAHVLRCPCEAEASMAPAMWGAVAVNRNGSLIVVRANRLGGSGAGLGWISGR
jgi:hypothetical protein